MERVMSSYRRGAVGRYADVIMAEIHGDMVAGTVPRDVGTFSGLHDHVDANEYLIDNLPGAGGDLDLSNAVADEVDRRLAAEALELGTGDTCECGRLVRFNGGSRARGHVVHLDDGSHQCRPCRFCRGN
jgi:hypothetical protein